MPPLAMDIDPVPLGHLAVMRVAGRDAASFLQGQLTSDVRLLGDGRTQLGACTTPRGRVIAVLRLRQTDDAIAVLLPGDLVTTVAQHLGRYVLRAKVAIEVESGLQIRPFDRRFDVDSVAGTAFDYRDGRRLVAAKAAAWLATGRDLPPSPTVDTDDAWRAADIAAGLPQVFKSTSEAFVPQMLNLDLLDGISFSKGCYSGQEIVARTQHLGRIKRRTLRFRLAPGPIPARLAGLHRDGEKVAEVLDGVACDDGVELLAVTALEARAGPLVSDDGRLATPLDLPYALPDGLTEGSAPLIPDAGAGTAGRPGSTAGS